MKKNKNNNSKKIKNYKKIITAILITVKLNYKCTYYSTYQAVKAPSRYPAANMIVWSLYKELFFPAPDAIFSTPQLYRAFRKIKRNF